MSQVTDRFLWDRMVSNRTFRIILRIERELEGRESLRLDSGQIRGIVDGGRTDSSREWLGEITRTGLYAITDSDRGAVVISRTGRRI